MSGDPVRAALDAAPKPPRTLRWEISSGVAVLLCPAEMTLTDLAEFEEVVRLQFNTLRRAAVTNAAQEGGGDGQ